MLNVDGKVRAMLQKKLQTDDDAPYHGKTLYLSAASTNVPSTFPTLQMDAEDEDVGEDLEGNVQVGISSIVQLKAFTNTNLNDAEKLIDSASEVMKSMYYRRIEHRTLSPEKPYCKVARFRRIVGAGDKWN